MLQRVEFTRNPNEKIGPFGTMIEKDPTIDRLQRKLMETFASIMPKEPEKPVIVNNVKEVTFEDALKELLAMGK